MNAFITLGLTKLFGGILTRFLSNENYILISGIAFGIIHEIALQSGLGEYCISEKVPRHSFVEANREGLVSVTGFVSLYLISVYIGSIVYKNQYLELNQYKNYIFKMSRIIFISFILTFISIYTTKISRRLSNIGYISWIVSLASSTLAISSIVFDFIMQIVIKSNKIPILFDLINYNGLIFFLISNLLTGFVNIFLDPRSRNIFESIIILLIYMSIPCTLNYFLYKQKIRIC